MTAPSLMRWLSDGQNGFAPADGAEIMKVVIRLNAVLPYPLVIYNAEMKQGVSSMELGAIGEPLSFVMRTQIRILNGFIRTASAEIRLRIPRKPLANAEVMERVGFRHGLDEIAAFRLLAGAGSISYALFSEWRLSSGIVRSATQ